MKVVAAWQDGDALILAFPSSLGGHYLVRAEVRGQMLMVVHSCPAAVNGKDCWHVKAAVETYREWHWWEPELPVKPVCRVIVANPCWRQILVPGTELEELFHGQHSA